MSRPAAASLSRGLPLPSLPPRALPPLPGLLTDALTDAPVRPRVRPHSHLRTCLHLCLLLALLAFAATPPQAAAANDANGQGAAAAGEQAEAPTVAVTVLARLPHDPQAFTQGLLLHQGALFESTGLYGQSSLRRLDPATGRVLARQPLPRKLFGEGLTACETSPRRLVQLTWREGVIRSYDPANLRLVAEHPLRGEGWGLACRGAELTVSDGTDTLRFLKAHTLAETGVARRVRDGARPVVRLNELEWVNGWLVANIWGEDRLAVIRPGTGPGVWRVALWINLSPLRRELPKNAETANGVAFDPAAQDGRGALYLTGKRWNTLFVAALPALMRQPPQDAAAKATGRE